MNLTGKISWAEIRSGDLACRACKEIGVAIRMDTGLCLVCDSATETVPMFARGCVVTRTLYCTCGPVPGISANGMTCSVHFEDRVQALITENGNLYARVNKKVADRPPFLGLPFCPVCSRKFATAEGKLEHYREGCDPKPARSEWDNILVGALLSAGALAVGVSGRSIVAFLGGLL